MYHYGVSVATDSLKSLRRLLGNVRARLLGRPPGYVWLEVSGDLPEFSPRLGLLRRRLAPFPAGPSLEALRGALEAVLYDGRPAGVVLGIRGLGAGWASLEELRGELLRFREAGGRVVAYLGEDVDSRAYYLACAADEVLAAPLATLVLTGLRSRVVFVREALERVGLRAEVLAVSPYKSAYDALSRTGFSREAREQAERLLDERFAELLEAVSGSRGIPGEAVRRLVDRAPLPAREALEAGLLDGVCYEDELPERLGGVRVARWGEARRSIRVPPERPRRRRVGLVSVSGLIVRGRSRSLPMPLPFFGGEQAGADSVSAALRAAERDRWVAAVLLHVESRGGDALASDLIWREVARLRRRKPVVVLMGNFAASGGYYVGAAADRIVARRNTLTGSVGVVLVRPVASGLYGRLGLRPEALQRGANAGIMDPATEPGPGELEALRRQLEYAYREFRMRVAGGRGIPPERLERLAGGRVWTGEEARRAGLVDGTGGFREALRLAGELGGVRVDGPGAVVRLSPRGSPPAPLPARDQEGAPPLSVGPWAIMPYDVCDI
ncbi:peptidase [Rubrobacter xylanophilus]|uniref:Peptidase n=1 Tax=Rubrobacter xylanophilus TaxID=49319 RepID=A0A510HFE8_9ACTN|nr:peptidase [Rubrobacter xylanophilus]